MSKISQETRNFWTIIKHHLCDNGLRELEMFYPELGHEIRTLRRYRPSQIQYATSFGQGLVAGSIADYVGVEWKSQVNGHRVTIVATPFSVATEGYVCFQTDIDNHIFTAPITDLRLSSEKFPQP